MMKRTLFILLGLLLIGVNVYAAGDLQVNGSLAVGTTPSTLSLDVIGKSRISKTTSSGGAVQRTIEIEAIGDGTFAGNAVIGINGTARTLPSATSSATGFFMQAQHETDVNTQNLKGGYFLVQYRSDAPTTIDTSLALHTLHSKSNVSTGATTVTEGYGLLSELRDEPSTGSLSFGSFSHLHLLNKDAAVTVNNLTGLWIDKQTGGGSSNYGIVLNGDGSWTASNETDFGAAIVFGTGQCCKIFAQGGVLKASDGTGYVTQFSPHDPETGEWIFYSQNVKTGRTVRVNMEKLVKAVEKLTGETFMVETLMEK